ncbi:MAG: HAD family hydrolase [Candidatus Micrarchaeia archaeon]
MENFVIIDSDSLVKDKKDISYYVYESIRNIYGIITNINLEKYKELTSKETAIEILKENGLSDSEITPRLDRYLEDLPYSYYNVAWSDKIESSNGAKQFLELLNKKKIEVGLISNEPTDLAKMRLKKLGLEKHFTFYSGAENGITPLEILKNGLAQAESNYNLASEQCVLISSSKRFLEAGKAFNTYTVGMASSPEEKGRLINAQPDEILPSFKEKPKVLKL